MSTSKSTKPSFREQDKQDNKKFFTVLAIITLVLLLLTYFIYNNAG